VRKLSRDDENLRREVERGELKPVGRLGSERKRYEKYAEATLKKDRRVNIRISGKDLSAIQKRALDEGIPYQTLIASLLHKYAAGRLVERSLARRSS
jgi:predicted DNA binding CopG/RHH family protein